MQLKQSALKNASISLQSGVIERLRVTPVSRLSLLMGTVLRDIVMFIVPALLVIFVASLFGFHFHWAGLAVLLILLSGQRHTQYRPSLASLPGYVAINDNYA